MAKIFEGSTEGNTSLVMELPNHYVLGGHLYKKAGLTPVPGGMFNLPGVNLGTARNGFLLGHAAGRGLWEDPYTELGTWHTISNVNDTRAFHAINAYPRAMQPRPFVMDKTQPQFAYVLTTGTFNPRYFPLTAPATAATGNKTNNLGANTQEDDARLSEFHKINVHTNEIIWTARPYNILPNAIIWDQDNVSVYFFGVVQDDARTTATLPVIGAVDKSTGQVTLWPLYMTSSMPTTPHICPAYTGWMAGTFLGIHNDHLWLYAQHSNNAAGSNPTNITMAPLAAVRTGNTSQVVTYAVPTPVTSTLTRRIADYRCSPVLAKANGDHYIYMQQGGNTTTYSLRRHKVYVYPLNLANSPTINFTGTFAVPQALAIYTYAAAGAPLHGVNTMWTWERDNGDETYTTFLLSLFHLTRSSTASDDSGMSQHLIKLTETEVNAGNSAELIDSIHDANYGVVWLDSLTFMLVGLRKLRIYRVNLAMECIELLITHAVPPPFDREIVYAAVDLSKNIWYVTRDMPSRSKYEVHFETAYVVSAVDIAFELAETEYTDEPISSFITVSVRNSMGESMESDVQLTLTGNAVFTDNTEKEIVIQTSLTEDTIVPFLITGPGYINCVGTVVS